MKIKQIISIIIFLLLSVTACQQNPELNLTNSQNSSPTLAVPTPAGTTAVIHGTIRSNGSNKAPEAIFYLAINSTANAKDVPAILAFSNQNSPRAEVTDAGEFVFRNVEPGQYAMMLWFPSKEPYFVPAANGEDYWWVNAGAGEVLEMGEVNVP
jgi:hypothetical protein